MDVARAEGDYCQFSSRYPGASLPASIRAAAQEPVELRAVELGELGVLRALAAVPAPEIALLPDAMAPPCMVSEIALLLCARGRAPS
jgi:hypothetical protein